MNLFYAVINTNTAPKPRENSLRDRKPDICFIRVICTESVLLKGCSLLLCVYAGKEVERKWKFSWGGCWLMRYGWSWRMDQGGKIQTKIIYFKDWSRSVTSNNLYCIYYLSHLSLLNIGDVDKAFLMSLPCDLEPTQCLLLRAKSSLKADSFILGLSRMSRVIIGRRRSHKEWQDSTEEREGKAKYTSSQLKHLLIRTVTVWVSVCARLWPSATH